jgi:outer membrane protein, heavy metal efflux system
MAGLVDNQLAQSDSVNRVAVRTDLPTLLKLCLLTLCFLATGCFSPPRAADRNTVSSQLLPRTGHTVGSANVPGAFVLPPGANLADGLTEDEAISIALWNNAAFQELLADLGIARGDLIQAGLLPNPEVLYFVQMPDKPFKYAFEIPIEAIWLRPIRVQSTLQESNRVADRMAQAGLDLIRDVRQAYADVLLAKERVRVAGEAVKLRGRIAELAEKRFKSGDISEQEEATARIDSLQAQQDATRIAFEIGIAEERLRNLLAIGNWREALQLEASPLPPKIELNADELCVQALQSRPDALAAAQAVNAAQARLDFAKLGWVRFLGILDATSGRKTGHEFGPAIRLTLPIFNWNQGAIVRAEAELERAQRNQHTVANQIILDVQRSLMQYRQAAAEIEVLLRKVRPEVEAAIRRAQGAYQEGNVTIFIVLETTRQLLDNYLREAVLVADLRRTWAELERSVGQRIAVGKSP